MPTDSLMPTAKSAFLTMAIVTLLAACAGPIKRAEQYGAQDEWMKAVIEYRKAYAKHPENVEYKSRLKQTELKAADFYYQRGLSQVEQGNLDGAIVQFQQGLASMPDHSKLLQAMNQTLARKEAESLYQEALSYQEAGKIEDAKDTLRRALQAYPDHPEATRALDEMEKQQQAGAVEGLALTSKVPITLNFRQTDLRTAFEFLAKSFGVNVIFDESFKSVPVTLFAKDVTFEQGLSLLLTTTKTFYKKIGPNTILVAPDSKEKRGQYEDHLVRTFQLNTVRAKDMADILKGVLTVKKLIVNDALNTLIVRDTPEIIELVEKIIDTNDRKSAEMILEVEILEVNRTKAERLGLDFGAYAFTAAVPSALTFKSSIRTQLRDTATLTVPAVTFRFFKQDVDAKTLANPKIRVLHGKSAKIHIGDRVPLRASTIVDATGQTRTTFEYRDVGIKLTAEPTIHIDNSATVKLGLEVSSLGQNVGTVNEPAFQIGTRNAETVMLLRDGETAILGGLIRDEERNNRVKVPGLGDIPALGSLFTSYDDSRGRTDVLLTITPRVVRSWDLAGRNAREFYSGSENNYSTKPLFAHLESVAAAAGGAAVSPQIEISDASKPATAAAIVTTPTATGATTTMSAAEPAQAAAAPPAAAGPVLAFAEPVYEVANGQEFEIRLTGENLAGVNSLPMEIMYNPQLIAFVRGEASQPAPESFKTDADQAKGVIAVNLSYKPGSAPTGSAVLARLTLRGAKPGISYLVYRAPAMQNAAGQTVNAQVRASRIVIK